ncbi:MAG TPA: hypothetical protein VG759_24815 [Candidatus Angelobacter sp.]|jgi:hypothetical protein|nr:hypothetical protein [Candidatus Angelobacter sp.]
MREMTITLDIRPEIEAELVRQAAAQGSALEEYVASLIEKAVNAPVESARSHLDALHKTLRETFESVRGLADDVDFARNKSTARPVNLS